METEELIKLVDGIYKNILDKFNPGARQMINAGKAYLKALHGAAAASRMYVDAISKLARQAQQGTWGGSSDIGVALFKIVEVYKEIQDRQMNILKAFYVDLLVPLETNLEKDTKVVQCEQKRFLQQHKQRSETYSKAAALMKKQRKKSRGSSKTGLAMDKELKNMQILEEEKTKLDAFCEQSLKNAMTQERRRYGFVLERQCSLSKHYLSYYTHGVEAYQENIEKWSDVAKTREYLPESVENIFTNKLKQISIWQNEDLYSNPRSPNLEDDRLSVNSQLRKTRSMDASCLDIRSIEEIVSPNSTLNRAKSEYNLNSSIHTNTQGSNTPTRQPTRSMAVPPPPTWDCQLARALYAYLSSGENQLSFHEGDLLALIGERNKGWQFGENLRTQCSGWFPLAYTEILDDPPTSPSRRSVASGSHTNNVSTPTIGNNYMSSIDTGTPSGNPPIETPGTRMFGDTLNLHRSSNTAKQIRRAIGSNIVPPPSLPAPVPVPSLPESKIVAAQSQNVSLGMKSSSSSYNFSTTPNATAYSTHPAPSRSDKPSAGIPLPFHLQSKGGKIGGPIGNASLHSSNDSGFSNDPPPQPEIDYSDDDSNHGQTKVSSRRKILKNIDDEDRKITRKPPPPPTKNTETPQVPKKRNPVQQSRSYGNLTDSHFLSDSPDISKKKNKLVKRTKSFWKFGKSASDNEILEGMALWKHKDLVDIESNASEPEDDGRNIGRRRKPSLAKSEDSDTTINNNNKIEVIPNKNGNRNKEEIKRSKSFKKKEESIKKEPSNNNESMYKKPNKSYNFEDQFYDDDGDGLMLKTLNRKNILQQYNTSSGTDSESESGMTSDDPYDSILVDDQKLRKNENQFPNVVELGKKLEKLSQKSKYLPEKEDKNRQDKNEIMKLERRHDDIVQLRENSFKTFGIEVQNRENGEKETVDDDKYYEEEHPKRKQEATRRSRPSYESIQSEVKTRSSSKRKSGKQRDADNNERHKNSYYDSTNDEFSDTVEPRSILPRSKLTKTNSNNSSHSKYDQDNNLMDYGETLQKRLKNPEYNSRFDERSPHNGNMYGPWYDLWGLDSTGTARKK
ncbi:GATA zinc finger domain-containing protein 14 isoform X1 [Diorhabda sublineata]|uniref:GATA zinc finger domain-containing protein 14 isoform X1 n=1 Tax=Diorhabda sublineata TaxID=1163346 RepID=UPI0024E09481|nr:GATA zinc finger domain-containing protein 14 isoform X1 [Diorhabda sublineata]XP_056633687.1 GATA zinc finger domain-containing protein 14 isoform X1 [Diorhabda sublineata]